MNTRQRNTAIYITARTRSRIGGSVMIMALLLLVIMTLLGLSIVALASASSRMSDRGVHKVEAGALAEAAVQKHFDTIRNYMSQNKAWSSGDIGTLPVTTLVSNDGYARISGTYWSEATLLNTGVTNDTLNSKQTTIYTIQLKGTGKASNGTKSDSYATFTVTQTRPLQATTLSLAFDAAAVIQSNSTVTLNTNGGFRTHSSGNGYDGSVLANAGVIWTPASGNKGSNPNSITIDGQVLAGGQAATDLTASPSGLGNSNGTKNYQTNAAAVERYGHPTALTNTISNLGSARTYPNAAAVAVWQTAWLAAATLGTAYPLGASSTTAPQVNGERRITAPALIVGDLTVPSGQLYLQPNADTTKSNVIYVTGDIKNSALLYNRGVTLVSLGKYKAMNSSAQYSLQTQSSPYTRTQLFAKTSLVSLAVASDAIDMGVNASSDTGLVYAALGGIICQANNNFTGILVAGGTGSTGGIIAGGPNSFDITYPAGALDARVDFKFSLTLALGDPTPGEINSTSITDPNQFF